MKFVPRVYSVKNKTGLTNPLKIVSLSNLTRKKLLQKCYQTLKLQNAKKGLKLHGKYGKNITMDKHL